MTSYFQPQEVDLKQNSKPEPCLTQKNHIYYLKLMI